MSKEKTSSGGTIAQNRKARHEYFIEDKIEAGLVLQGWEVKAIRSGRMTITEAYVIFKKGEAFLFNSQITPLLSASTHEPEIGREIFQVREHLVYVRTWHAEPLRERRGVQPAREFLGRDERGVAKQHHDRWHPDAC